MATLGGATVTIDRNYFETLMRRAKFNSDAVDDADPSMGAAAHISVSKAEYEILARVARQYANLTRNLMRGGIDENTISLLSADDSTSWPNQEQLTTASAAPTPSQPTDGGVRLHSATQPTHIHEDSNYRGYQNGYGNYRGQYPPAVQRHKSGDWAECANSHDEHSSTEGPGEAGRVPGANENVEAQMAGGPPLLRVATRSILLYNLPEGLTHGDITNVVRGGPVLDIFFRNDRSVAVSFVHSQDARAFFEHVRKHDLYLKNKRVEIKWNDRQFILPGHVANKLRIGATRNLVIRRCSNAHTEETVRDDLEHIHNLIVMKVEFVGGSCYIKTNSVHNAMFARTCMMSRVKYKGSKIEWDADECAQPIEAVSQRPPQVAREYSAPKPVARQISNRFQALYLDGDEDREDEDEDQDQDDMGVHARSSMKVAL